MDDLGMLDLMERYLEGTLSPEETKAFEAMREQNAELDQMVVEHQLFLAGLRQYGDRKALKHDLNQIHQKLVMEGALSENPADAKAAPVIKFWQRYKRTIGVAASIACITALSITLALQSLAPKPSQGYLQKLSRKMSELEGKQKEQTLKIDRLIDSTAQASKSPDRAQKSGGTSFLIDEDGYLITNSHVVAGATTLIVVNKGREYIANKVYEDAQTDLAILKIEDKDWKPGFRLPYNLRKTAVDLGEEIFTLGYPRNEVVYNRGYMSARSGYQDDTLSIQLAISANPGNSGGPVFDRNGDVIGILSTRDRQSNDVVFASKASNILLAIEALKKDSAHAQLNAPRHSVLKGMERVQQIKKVQDCVFMVKGY